METYRIAFNADRQEYSLIWHDKVDVILGVYETRTDAAEHMELAIENDAEFEGRSAIT